MGIGRVWFVNDKLRVGIHYLVVKFWLPVFVLFAVLIIFFLTEVIIQWYNTRSKNISPVFKKKLKYLYLQFRR